MPIKPPGKHPFAPWLQNHRALTRKGGRAIGSADLLLTPLIDMFVILVVFLIMNFSATGELIKVDRTVRLPEARAGVELEKAPVIAISKQIVSLDGRFVGDYADILADEDLRIQPLTDMLRDLRNQNTQRGGPDSFKGQVIINCDREVDFKVVRKVMYAASEAGYLKVNYAVLQNKRGPAEAKGGQI